jgi:hypothetical protein
VNRQIVVARRLERPSRRPRRRRGEPLRRRARRRAPPRRRRDRAGGSPAPPGRRSSTPRQHRGSAGQQHEWIVIAAEGLDAKFDAIRPHGSQRPHRFPLRVGLAPLSPSDPRSTRNSSASSASCVRTQILRRDRRPPDLSRGNPETPDNFWFVEGRTPHPPLATSQHVMCLSSPVLLGPREEAPNEGHCASHVGEESSRERGA